MQKYRMIILGLIFFLFNISCIPNSQINSYKLIFIDANGKIVLGNLKNKRLKTIYDTKTVTARIEFLSKGKKGKFFFQECGIPCVIKEFNLTTKNVRTLFVGKMPVYNKSAKIVFFYKKINSKKYALFYTFLSNLNEHHQIAIAPSNYLFKKGGEMEIRVPVVPISERKVVFVHHDRRLAIFDIDTKKIEITKSSGMLPYIWRNKTKKLIAQDWKTKEIMEIDLESGDQKKWSDLKNIRGIVYIAEEDTLIFGQTRLGFPFQEYRNIYKRNLSTGVESVLFENNFIWSGFIL